MPPFLANRAQRARLIPPSESLVYPSFSLSLQPSLVLRLRRGSIVCNRNWLVNAELLPPACACRCLVRRTMTMIILIHPWTDLKNHVQKSLSFSSCLILSLKNVLLISWGVLYHFSHAYNTGTRQWSQRLWTFFYNNTIIFWNTWSRFSIVDQLTS